MRPDRQFPVLVQNEMVTSYCAAAAAPRHPSQILNISEQHGRIKKGPGFRKFSGYLTDLQSTLMTAW